MISSLPLLRDFGVIVTLNVTIALLAALVVMPPIMVWVDDQGWLGLEPQIDPGRAVRLAAPFPGDQTLLAGLGAVAFIGAGAAVYASADTSEGTADRIQYEAVALPTTTTTTTTTTLPPTTTTTAPAPVTTVEGQEPVPTEPPTPTTEPGPLIDPTQFPDAPPEGTFTQALFDLLTAEGVPGKVSHCVIVTSYERGGGEAALVPLLLASDPAALATVQQAGLDCGADPDQVDAAIAAGTGG